MLTHFFFVPSDSLLGSVYFSNSKQIIVSNRIVYILVLVHPVIKFTAGNSSLWKTRESFLLILNLWYLISPFLSNPKINILYTYFNNYFWFHALRKLSTIVNINLISFSEQSFTSLISLSFKYWRFFQILIKNLFKW